ncbi:hydrogenase 4 subunit F [Metallosphaera tengchongensis]|uniref:Hydrogenase 4 subunit F n=1 Tax=Metallosphaera tengchongensis TaxID=1532350 RepID=A0A6N0P004_9CREN|nr:proton-conducting transporter membrane subunit [Metallosphaera tengchongensis]QKR00630.1 hydrogenase 4 subunit F [Metallosphaera tengchongensis]
MNGLTEALLVIVPLLSNVFIWKVKYSSLASSVLTLTLSLISYFDLPVFTPTLYVTRFTWYFLVMVASVYFSSTVYSVIYERVDKLRERNYFYFMNMFSASMFFTLIVNNLGLMWVGLEATTISSVLLVTHEGTQEALEAGWRYVIIVSTGITFAFISLILLYFGLHTLQISSILYPHASPLFALASVIALMGFGTKAGLFPVNTWLPDAHSEAPPAVSAMFSGVLLPVAVYILHLIYVIAPLQSVYSWTATISVLVASLMMAGQRYYKRMFAYSTIENMGVAILGISTSSTMGIAILLVSHAFAKAGAFYASGAIMRTVGSKQINEYGLISSPMTSAGLLMSSLAVTGAPPFANFFGEFLILYNVLGSHMVAQFFVTLLSLALAFISVNYHVSRMIFKGNWKGQEGKSLSVLALMTALVPLTIGIYLLVGGLP